MSSTKESEVLSILQPDLLTVEELVGRIQSRCCRIENLGVMSKEGLVGLFRRMILPLPQRFYRTNRRGKMLTSRRVKAGLEGRRREEGCSDVRVTSRLSASNSHLRTSGGSDSNKIRLKNDRNVSSSKDLDKIVINDRRKLGGNEKSEDERRNGKNSGCDSHSSRKITLKRSPVDEKPSSGSTSPSERKKQRTAIKWP